MLNDLKIPKGDFKPAEQSVSDNVSYPVTVTCKNLKGGTALWIYINASVAKSLGWSVGQDFAVQQMLHDDNVYFRLSREPGALNALMAQPTRKGKSATGNVHLRIYRLQNCPAAAFKNGVDFKADNGALVFALPIGENPLVGKRSGPKKNSKRKEVNPREAASTTKRRFLPNAKEIEKKIEAEIIPPKMPLDDSQLAEGIAPVGRSGDGSIDWQIAHDDLIWREYEAGVAMADIAAHLGNSVHATDVTARVRRLRFAKGQKR